MAKSKKSSTLYQTYKKLYNAEKEALQKKNIQMAFPPLSYTKFRTTYAALYNERKLAIKNNERRSVGNLTRDIVTSQKYKISYTQARALKTAPLVQSEIIKLEELIKKENIKIEEQNKLIQRKNKIRKSQGREEIPLLPRKKLNIDFILNNPEAYKKTIDWNIVNQEYKNYKEKYKSLHPGASQHEIVQMASEYISETIFGSK